MKAVIYFTEVAQQYEHKNMEHMIGEKLLETGLLREYGLKLEREPRATGEHGKPFLSLQPKIHYNITLDADEPEKAFFTQWVLREAYIKWTGEGLSRDLRTISLDEGSYILLDLGEDYSGAIWSQDHLELQWEHVDVQLP